MDSSGFCGDKTDEVMLEVGFNGRHLGRTCRSTSSSSGSGKCGIASFPTMATGGRVMSADNSTPASGGTGGMGLWLLEHDQASSYNIFISILVF
jgi:hypothetical protein